MSPLRKGRKISIRRPRREKRENVSRERQNKHACRRVTSFFFFSSFSFLLDVAIFSSVLRPTRLLPHGRSCVIPFFRDDSRGDAFTAISFRESRRFEGERKKESSSCHNIELRSKDASVALRISSLHARRQKTVARRGEERWSESTHEIYVNVGLVTTSPKKNNAVSCPSSGKRS